MQPLDVMARERLRGNNALAVSQSERALYQLQALDLGTMLSCFGCENKKWRTFH